MILGISPEFEAKNEHAAIHQLLDGGMDLFHIRKYHYSDEMLKTYIEKIDENLRGRLVLHSHFHLAKELGIKRLHCNEKIRRTDLSFSTDGFAFSTSVHSITDFNQLTDEWKYAFLSPVFPSISKKGYGTMQSVFGELGQRENHTVALIALGGIHSENYKNVRMQGADGAALLGSIWQCPQPLNILKKCKEIDRLF